MSSPLQRQRSVRPIKPRIVIFVEGQTEKQYFNALKQIATAVAIDPRCEKNPADMAKEAKKVIRGEWNKKRDQLWFVLDNEEPDKRQTPEYWQELSDFCKAHQKISCELCISNVCFETWLLAHFQNHGLHENAKNLARSLTSVLGYDYRKGTNLRVDAFLSRLETALQNANTSPLADCPPPIGHSHVPHLFDSLKIP